MNKTKSLKIDEKFIEEVCNALKEGRRLRKKLPTISGEIFVDRQLPYLCVYRIPENKADSEVLTDWGTDHLLYGESSYLIAPGSEEDYEEVNKLVYSVATELKKSYGALFAEGEATARAASCEAAQACATGEATTT